MKISPNSERTSGRLLSCGILFFLLMLTSCSQDDPKPVNEEEVITTVEVMLVPEGAGETVTLKFFDADGELGNTAPVVTVSGSLNASTGYTARLSLSNETANPPADITEEILEEADDHLFCFAVDGPVSIRYNDEDSEGRPIGLSTLWQTSDQGLAQVTISLRHQPGTKTGDCPGSGDTDIEITFDVEVR